MGFLDLPEEPFVKVHTSNGRGFTPEEVAQRCADKLMSVSESAIPEIRDQALAYRQNIEKLLVFYMKEAIRSDRTTVYNAIRDAGHPDLANAIRRL
jgi:hypothetical protein|tara:strand:- start:498 stop:785 length:288 start_codon:yes stop_codon:yes gene_type:complete